MLSRKFVISACAAAMFTAANARSASAQLQPLEARTEFTFNQPVEMPGTTLLPGTYVFTFSDDGRKVMLVQDKVSNKSHGMFPTISAQRTTPSDEAQLRFLETAAGQPAAVKTWWYPGNTFGREFIYPREQARRLAMATKTTVLTTKADTASTDQVKTADLEYVSPSGQESTVVENAPPTENAQPTSVAANVDRTPVQ